MGYIYSLGSLEQNPRLPQSDLIKSSSYLYLSSIFRTKFSLCVPQLPPSWFHKETVSFWRENVLRRLSK